MANNVWFISGATSGFGKEIAIEALSRGDKVVATSRNASGFTELEEKGALLIDLDVTSNEEQIEDAFQKALETFGKITHFVNSAGYVLQGPAESVSAEEAFDAFNVNVLGLIKLTRHEVGILRPQGHGVIANFGSRASWSGGPNYSIYASTKWAVSGFTESVCHEVKPFGVDVISIEPGHFRTGFLKRGGGNRLFTKNQMEEIYTEGPVAASREALDSFDSHQPGDPVKAAKVIVDVLTKTGVAAGKEIPRRLLLGSDCLDKVRGILREHEQSILEWEEVTLSTDFE